MECTFAINSTAPGFVLIQDEHSQYTINTTLQRHEGDVSKGSVNITDLPAGEYRVTAYDQLKDYLDDILPAYDYFTINSKLIQVLVIVLNPSTSSSASSMGVTGKILVLSISGYGFVVSQASWITFFTFNFHTILVEITYTERPSGSSPLSSVIQTPVVQFENTNIVVILVSSVATGFLLLLCAVIFIVILMCATIIMKRRNKKGVLGLHCKNMQFSFFYRSSIHRPHSC